MDVTITEAISTESWGFVDGRQVKKFTLKNKNKLEVDIISYGATIISIRMPDKYEKIEDLVCGFDNIEGYLSKENPYLGATCGRVANRIKNGQFFVGKTQYQVSKNSEKNSLHGGFEGWNAKNWEAVIIDNTVVMTLLSADGDEGFPGAIIASVQFLLTDDGKLIIEMVASSSKPTPINMTNHSYFNLAGHGSNAAEIYKHQIILNADFWTVTDNDNIPTGEIRSVNNSIFDLRKITVIGDVIHKAPNGGFDNNFCILVNDTEKKEKFVAKVIHPDSGRTLEVFSNQPGVQFYTANYFPDPLSNKNLLGKQGNNYKKHGAFCLETQNYPDAVNHDNFPNSILNPHNQYYHIVTYKFGTTA